MNFDGVDIKIDQIDDLINLIFDFFKEIVSVFQPWPEPVVHFCADIPKWLLVFISVSGVTVILPHKPRRASNAPRDMHRIRNTNTGTPPTPHEYTGTRGIIPSKQQTSTR